MTFASTLIVATLVAQNPLPDAMDHLKSAEVRPNIGLLLDSSCSMRFNPQINTNCVWWANNFNGGDLTFTKNQVMRSVLTGCRSPSDGIIDKWIDRVNFSIFHFGRRVELVTPFDSDQLTLEAGAMSIGNTGGTPMTLGIHDHARYFQNYFTGGNTLQCRPNFLLLLSDGNPNGGSKTYNMNCPVPGDPRTSKYVRSWEPWEGAEYLTEHYDMLCDVPGYQDIRTYTIGFGAPGSFSPSNLQNIATEGLGEYYYAADVQQLDQAFTQIIQSMASRAALFYAAPAVELEGLFSGNVVYTSAFKPNSQGPWYGTIKKHCIEPNTDSSGLYDINDRSCVFKSHDGKTLVTNPDALDLWTGTTTTAATQGGAGAVQLARLGTPGGVPTAPYRPRNIRTWWPNSPYYRPVQPANWRYNHSWMSPTEHLKLINKLHGYTYNADASGNPVTVAEWPLGDPVHSTTVLLRYGKNCDLPGKCFVVIGANDGQLHFFDSANGVEKTALIPGEVWRPNNVRQDEMRDYINQPDVDVVHRYYIDGGMTLFHDDADGDRVIDSSETAYLLVGLGRAGAGYYQIPVSRFNGYISRNRNPVRPLLNTKNTTFEDLQDTWAAPWAGQFMHQGAIRNVAVFPSGHIKAFDAPGHPTPSRAPTRRDLQPGALWRSCNQTADASGLPRTMCDQTTPGGYPDPAPQDVTIGPFTYPNAVAVRVNFNVFDLGPDDKVEIRDGSGNVIQTRTGDQRGWSPWVYDSQLELRFLTNGVQTSDIGFRIRAFQFRRIDPPGVREHYPTVYVMDLDKWNGPAPRDFVKDANDGGTVLRVTRSCAANPGTGLCIDKTTSPELINMTCPISTEISVFTNNSLMTAMYWGDECGQIWKAWQTDPGLGIKWKARRILSTNNTPILASQLASLGRSEDFRKIFRRLDLVSSTCPGRRVVGVYFGTGDVQRPSARNTLSNPLLNNGRDVVGVVWDSDALPPGGATMINLAAVDTIDSIDPKTLYATGSHGWYWSLRKDERMLRDPLVFEGVAHYKTFQPTTAAAECSRATGVDRIYAVNNCSAEARVDNNSDGTHSANEREAWQGQTDVGGNLLIVTPENGAPIVSHANLLKESKATIDQERREKVPRIYNWREPRRID